MHASYTFGSGTYDDEVTLSGDPTSRSGSIELAFEYARSTVTLTRHNAEQLYVALGAMLGVRSPKLLTEHWDGSKS